MNRLLSSRPLFRTAVVAVVAVGLAAGPVGAVHWPFFGGDAGRSGYQPVDEGSGPIDFVYSRTGAEDRDIVTSIVTGAGMPAEQRVVYGTADGRIHVRRLLDGTVVGPPGGVDVSDQPNAFGDGVVGSVTPTETSSGTGQGQVFAPHNDAAGVSIAQIDEATGVLVQDVAVGAAAGFDVNSSALLGAADAGGVRPLFFVAESAAGEQVLFRVPVTNAAATTATIGAATKTADVNATPEASPTLAFLEAPGTTGGATAAYVAVGTLDGRVLTFTAGDLASGPAASVAGPDEAVQTPSVPVSDTGLTPGSMGSNATKAPFLFVASAANADFDDARARVHRLTQPGSAATFSEIESAALPGSPSSALAVDLEVVNGTPEATASVFLATEANLYALRTTDLTVSARLSPNNARQGGLDGFAATVPAASGDLVFVTTDAGQQLVLRSATLQPLAASEFAQHSSNAGSVLALGQPSISRRFVQFTSDRGLFVYRFRDLGTTTTTTTSVPATTPTTGGGTTPTTAAPTGTDTRNGYRLVGADGGVFAFGQAPFLGSAGGLRLNQPIVASAATAPGRAGGYRLLGADGGVFAFGDARFFGSTGAIRLNRPMVGLASTPSGNGYWAVAADGGVFAFGDARFYGSTGSIRLNRPIVGMAATPSGNGYWLVASDGGVFAFGDARFVGSTGGIRLNQPMVGMASTPSGTGYWLVASDGGIFAFGDAAFAGSAARLALRQRVVGIERTRTGRGYWLVAADGGVFAFGDAPFVGSVGGIRINAPIVSLTALR